jgi:hypothetical protein
MKPRVVLVAALIVWMVFFALSIIMAVSTEPTGDGFTRGMNRAMVFVKWQAAAFIVSLISFFMARGKTTDLSQILRFIGKTPLYAHGLILVLVVGALLYAILIH